MDLNMSTEPRQKGVKTQLLAEDFKQIGDRSGSTIRITVSLTESTKSNCPELNFIELSTNKQNENNPHLAAPGKEFEQEEEELKKIAESLNEKYGYSKKKNKRKIFMGLGEGYNLEDSFIDDDDAYEEEIPWEYDPLHVGYYINKGTLLCTNEPAKSATKNDESRKPAYRAPNDGGADDDDDDEESVQEEIRGRKKMRFPDDGDDKSQVKKRRIQFSTVKSFNNKNDDDDDDDKNNNINEPIYINDTINESRTTSTPVNTNKTNTSTCNHLHTNNLNNNNNYKNNKSNKNNINNNSNNTKDNEANSKLIEELKDQVIEEMTRLKGHMAVDDSCNKLLSHPDLLDKLSRVYSLVQTYPWKTKMRIFESFGECSGLQKEVVFKRVKKHAIEVLRQKVLQARQHLKEAVDALMTSLVLKYQQEVAERERLRQEMKAALTSVHEVGKEGRAKQDGVEPSSGDSNDEVRGEVKVETKGDLKRSQAPRKKFVWDACTRGRLREVVSLCMQQFEAGRIKCQTAEEYLKAFVDAEVLPIWPPGWMQLRILLKESRSAHVKWTADPNRSKVPKVKKQQKRVAGVDAVSIQAPPFNPVTDLSPSTNNNATNLNQHPPANATLNNNNNNNRVDLQNASNSNTNIPIIFLENCNTNNSSSVNDSATLSSKDTFPPSNCTLPNISSASHTNNNISPTSINVPNCSTTNNIKNNLHNYNSNTASKDSRDSSAALVMRKTEEVGQERLPLQHSTAPAAKPAVISVHESPCQKNDMQTAPDNNSNINNNPNNSNISISNPNNSNPFAVTSSDFTTLKKKAVARETRQISIINLTGDAPSDRHVVDKRPSLNHNATSMHSVSLQDASAGILEASLQPHNALPPPPQNLLQKFAQQQQPKQIQQQQPNQVQQQHFVGNTQVGSSRSFTTPPQQQLCASTTTKQLQQYTQQTSNQSPKNPGMSPLSPPPFRRPHLSLSDPDHHHHQSHLSSNEPFKHPPSKASSLPSEQVSFGHMNNPIQAVQLQLQLQQQTQHISKLQHTLQHQNVYQNAHLGFNQQQ